MGEEVFNVLLAREELVQVASDIVFRSKEYEALLAMVDEKVGVGGTITVGEFRDLAQTSRKYAMAFLEHLDELGVSVREGDTRRLRKPALKTLTDSAVPLIISFALSRQVKLGLFVCIPNFPAIRRHDAQGLR